MVIMLTMGCYSSVTRVVAAAIEQHLIAVLYGQQMKLPFTV